MKRRDPKIVFKLFSLIFSYPDEDTIHRITELSSEFPELEELSLFREDNMEELQHEFTKTFISAHPSTPCPPYESYYREGIVYGESSVEVRKIYESRGLKYSYESEPPDHISVELEYLSIDFDIDFLNRLKEWIFEFTKCVKSNSKVYGIFAEKLEKFLKEL